MAGAFSDQFADQFDVEADAGGPVHPLTIQLTDDAGNTISGDVDVRHRQGRSFIAYLDEAETTEAQFPASTSEQGNITLWMPAGPFEWTASHNGDALPWLPVDVPAIEGPQGPAGPPGDPGAAEVYEQPDEPDTTTVGAIWIDIDEEPPGTGVGADGGGPGAVYGGTRPLDGGGVV